MDEADRCSLVGLMYDGKLVFCDSPQKIRSEIEGDLIEILLEDWQTAQQVIEGLPGIKEIQTYGEALHIFVDSADLRLSQIKLALNEKGLIFSEPRQAPARMEEAFISLIRQIELGRSSQF
jgi:ABC-2 type transport system ATP-binding protein